MCVSIHKFWIVLTFVVTVTGNLDECKTFLLQNDTLISRIFLQKVTISFLRTLALNLVCDEFNFLESRHPGLYFVDSMKKDDAMLPGTYWCGTGNSSSDATQLGVFSETDYCCREHDQCQEYFMSGECKQGFCNNEPFTISECSCDEKFYGCLKQANDDATTLVGYLYFDIIGIQCFRYTHPTLGCKEEHPTGCCTDYNYDNNAPETIQLFCNPSFTQNITSTNQLK